MFYSLVIYPLTQIIELVYSFCNKILNNPGLSIFGVSAAVSLLTLPLYVVAEHWQEVEREKQKSMKNEVDKIKAVFKGNERFMILSTYYRQQHYHPIMALRSAFGLLIQIPFFTAAYMCLSNMTALKGASFLFIRDMGSPDSLFSIGNFNVNVLPILMTIINLISGAIYTKGFSLKEKSYTFGLALIFVVILYNSPAGLVLYWTMNNIFSLVKNVFYKMKHPVKTLYILACAFVTFVILYLPIKHVLSAKRIVLVSAFFALVYFAPLYVKIANHLIDKTFVKLRDNFKYRFSIFIFSAVGITLLVGLLIPSLLISSSPEEFSGIDGIGNPVLFIRNTFFQAAGFFLVWGSLIFFLYHERMQTLIAFALASVFAASILDAFVFAGNYGTLSKLLRFTEIASVDSSAPMILLNLFCVALAVLLVVLVLKFRHQVVLSYLLGFTCAGLFAPSCFYISKINKGYGSYKEKIAGNKSIKEIEPIFHLSKTGKNVILLYLDRAQSQYLLPLFDECPELYKQFSGFTFYPDTVSFNGHTLFGAPPCYGGYEYTPEEMNNRKTEKLVDKTNEALLLLPRIFTEQAENYSAIVTDSSWANWSWIPDLSIYQNYPKIDAHLTDSVYTDIWYKEHQDTANFAVISTTLKRNILWYSFFKCAPLALRPAFYNDGAYWSTNAKNDDYNDYLDGYAVLDYLPRLTDFNSKTENVYLNIVNNTPHDGLLLQAPEYKPESQITDYGKYGKNKSYHSFAGAMRRVGDFFEYLQKNGVYDNTRIVIVADHGASGKEDCFEWNEKFEKIGPGHLHPLLMFKDFGSSGKLKVDESFMTNADAPVLITKGIVENPKNPFTEKEIDSKAKENGALITNTNIYMPYHNKSEYEITAEPDSWWRVRGDIFDSSSWTEERH